MYLSRAARSAATSFLLTVAVLVALNVAFG